MPRRAASITQADVARALRAAQSAGPAWRVEIDGGVIRLLQGENSPIGQETDSRVIALKREIVL